MTTVADLGAAVQDSDDFWAAHWRSNGNNYYVCSYSNLCSDSGLLYYNMPKAVYVYDPASGVNLKPDLKSPTASSTATIRLRLIPREPWRSSAAAS